MPIGRPHFVALFIVIYSWTSVYALKDLTTKVQDTALGDELPYSNLLTWPVCDFLLIHG
jgi:hypothetical protein